MTENLNFRRKAILSVVVILAALACILWFPLNGEKPFRLGLDLQGGTRLVYKFDFDQAFKEGVISSSEFASKEDLLFETANIIRGRVDPKGVMELSLRPEGQDRLVIELPGAAELATSEVFSKLAEAMPADPGAPGGKTILLDTAEASGDPKAKQEAARIINSFPLSGGTVQVDEEKMVYRSRTGAALSVETRGAENTSIAAHAAGAPVELLTTDDIQRRIENVGDMRFFLAALPADYTALGTDQATEQKKVDDWRAANPQSPIEDFNRLPPERGGPPNRLQWFPHRQRSDELQDATQQRPVVGLILPRSNTPGDDPQLWVFTGADLAQVGFTTDNFGYPAVAFEMSTAKQGPFADFTGGNIDRGMAIVMNGEIVTLATIQSRLMGQSLINGGSGGFTNKEVTDLISVLRSGSLRIKPVLLDKARVGASLGDEYVTRAFYSSMAALALIAVFMIFFYRRLGVFSVIGLVVNILVLLGSLSFLRATLTLPGVAGIILTLGMAVDSNILIYERLREELNRGLKLVQAVKAAFDRAAVTIIDSHVTQLIAGVILYFVGTGPIRGFATTLNIGILTTLFSVLVVTEVMVMWDVKRGRKRYSMIRVLEKPHFDFMKAAKWAIPSSAVLILAGLVLFATLPNEKKLGIDFLGGFTVTARTQEPQREETIRQLVQGVRGTIGESAQIQAISDSGDKQTGFTSWRITFKLHGEETDARKGTGETGLKEIQKVLKPVLQRGPVELSILPDADKPPVQGEIYFEEEHPKEDVAQVLASAGIQEPQVEPFAGHRYAHTFKGGLPPEASVDEVRAAVTSAFTGTRDSKAVPYRLMSPIPESAFVGAQVGGELRDKAVLAVILSLLGTVMYLRIRFAEYSYGIAVVVSLLHDVLMALGALAVAVEFGLLQAELDLSMIAAFLTIIGYSQNDTIVIFDRVRENLPKSKKPLRDILNDSINETLGRTLLTTATVVLTLLVLFLFNVGSRNVLEGFSFCMLVGVLSGTYSTIYVASPVLLWFERRAKRREAESSERSSSSPAAT